ncbi:hypothetical protein [Burkholderia sp. Ac-20379]|uniref:hypothetical protein n=1 Tax=Burkholderia sp. Ac-20379 TaxID=2703900 RepID=UPI0019811028|nr:hypothetical protein [Burkholderia sp. Ac-20379]MBN3724170.1 hypothetical protein [Burkholderia sp. Ac-20379]
MAIDQIIDVIAVRYRFMAAAGAVDMPRFMTRALVVRRALIGVAAAHLDDVLVDMIAVRMMQVAVVEVIHVVAVLDRGVAAIRAVRVRMGAGVLVIA